MLDRIILHIGMRKTGSKSIQHAMQHCSEAWVAGGVYPLLPPRGEPFKNLYLLIRSRPQEGLQVIQHAVQAAQTAGLKTVLISSEDFYYLPEDRIDAMLTFCLSLARHVEVICCIRPQDEYLQSAYSQYAAAGLWVGNLQDNHNAFLNALQPFLAYSDRLTTWRRDRCMLSVLPITQTDSLAFVCERAGADRSSMDTGPGNRRESIDLLRACVLAGASIATSKGVALHQFHDLNRYVDFRSIFRTGLRSSVNGHGARFDLLRLDQRKAIRARFFEQNEQLTNSDTFLRDVVGNRYEPLTFEAVSPRSVENIVGALATRIAMSAAV